MNVTIDLEKYRYLSEPYPHCVIDNFFNEYTANKLHDELTALSIENATHKFTDKNSPFEYNKFAFSNIDEFRPSLKEAFVYLNSKEFIAQIEKLTGITGIVYGDYKLVGAGVHIITKGGYLGMHTDFNTYYHPTHGKLDRRINLLVYMNKDWDSSYKGDLLMYNPRHVSDPNNIPVQKRVQPNFNRCLVFSTTNRSVHGHPEPLNVPSEDIRRQSIAVYYYTKNQNQHIDFEGDRQHGTLWHRPPMV